MSGKMGKVILVGAGPGDPGLLTVRGLDALKSAEVLIYDYLASAEVVAECDAPEKIYVGKTGAAHTLEQEEINELIVAKAKEGKLVVRLKGGDPYIFGRGSEEAEFCRANGVDVQVLPGIPAALGAAAYAGVPLTDRRFTSAVMLITGHEDPTKETSSIDWESLARSKATLVFYMGVKNLPSIASKLLEHGLPGDMPVAIIERATTPKQRTVTATLETAAAVALEKDVRAPALTIVGKVASLAGELGWFQSQPLFGRTIAVTRTRAQSSGLVKQLRALGAEVIETPTIAIEPPDSWGALDGAISSIADFDWVIFTSANAVDSFMERLEAAGRDARDLAGIKFAAIGPATGERLKALGIRPDFMPKKFVAESVAEGMLAEFEIVGKRILLPRSAIARRELPLLLERAGTQVLEVEAYKTALPDTDVSTLKKLIEEGKIDFVTFTSSSTARHFVELLGADFVAANRSRFKAASIGPITTDTLKEFGLEPAIEAGEYTIPGLVEAILSHEAGRVNKG